MCCNRSTLIPSVLFAIVAMPRLGSRKELCACITDRSRISTTCLSTVILSITQLPAIKQFAGPARYNERNLSGLAA
jgi:hypothetical protein